MAKYTVELSRGARRDLESLPAKVVQRIFPRIEALIENPRPNGARKLEGEDNMYRIRIGDYRVLYTISDRQKRVDVEAVLHRSKAYRALN